LLFLKINRLRQAGPAQKFLMNNAAYLFLFIYTTKNNHILY